MFVSYVYEHVYGCEHICMNECMCVYLNMSMHEHVCRSMYVESMIMYMRISVCACMCISVIVSVCV